MNCPFHRNSAILFLSSSKHSVQKYLEFIALYARHFPYRSVDCQSDTKQSCLALLQSNLGIKLIVDQNYTTGRYFFIVVYRVVVISITLDGLRGEGGGVNLTPLDFFGFKYLLLDRLSKAMAPLFFVR